MVIKLNKVRSVDIKNMDADVLEKVDKWDIHIDS